MLNNKNSAYLITTNPAENYRIIGRILISSTAKISSAVNRATKAKQEWKEIGVDKRTAILSEILNKFHARKDELIKLIVEETGKTIRYARNEFERHSTDFTWFLDNAKNALADTITFEDSKSVHTVVYEPRGVTAVITPWNHPYGMFVWGVIPNLIVGNTVIYKASSECPKSGKLIEDIMSSCNLPEGVFSQIYGHSDVGEKLLNQKIDFIWFTGSSSVGKKIYKIAADKFIGAVMELGGSNPAIMFDDVNIDDLIEKIYNKRFATCGQACDGLKRLLIQESIFNKTIEKLKKRFEKIIVGNPLDEKTDIASLISKRQFDLLEDQVNDAILHGAKVICGGKKPDNLKGAYFLPTLLINIKRSMKVWKEEVFGPVLVALPFKNEKEAIMLANDTKYGLGAIIFTKDKKRARRVAQRVNAGNIEINLANHWLPCNPFGGYKESGLGREHGVIGLRELCQVKLISEDKRI